MKELIGQQCRCVFNLPINEWPFDGHPAWVDVVDVDLPMVCMKSSFAGKPVWVNAAIIKTIEPTSNTYSQEFESWWAEHAKDFGGGVRYKHSAWEAWKAGRTVTD